MNKSALLVSVGLVLTVPLASATPAAAMTIKKDENCVAVISPTVHYNGGSPTVSDPVATVTVNNCVTVTP